MSRHQKNLKFRISATTGGLWGCISQHHPGSDPGIRRFRQISRGGVIGCDTGVLRMAVIDDGVDDCVLDGGLGMGALTWGPWHGGLGMGPWHGALDKGSLNHILGNTPNFLPRGQK